MRRSQDIPHIAREIRLLRESGRLRTFARMFMNPASELRLGNQRRNAGNGTMFTYLRHDHIHPHFSRKNPLKIQDHGWKHLLDAACSPDLRTSNRHNFRLLASPSINEAQ